MYAVCVFIIVMVSIHAPARGATCLCPVSADIVVVSIHAPARGATLASSATAFCSSPSFNPRARKGRDRRFARHLVFAPVSIHAPARGATVTTHDDREICEFQSTRPQGARLAHVLERQARRDVSIHAPARGATPSGRAPTRYGSSFNPRARKGRDVLPARILEGKQVSIHAPARGATHFRQAGHKAQMFQSTRPQGARQPWL